MAYINFEEGRYSININIEKRINNNDKVKQYILRNKEKLINYTPCKEYSFKKFKDNNFGKEGILDESEFRIIESKDILCTTFLGCNFKKIVIL